MSVIGVVLTLICTGEYISEAQAIAGAKGYTAQPLHEARSFALALANASDSY